MVTRQQLYRCTWMPLQMTKFFEFVNLFVYFDVTLLIL
jgi:hypothetical protein